MQGLAKQSDKYMKLPSTFQIGWEVCLQFGESNPILRGCNVTKVLFARDKVFYDIQVAIYEPGETPDGYLPKCIGHTRIHSVDSAFVKPFDYGRTVITKWNPRTEYPDSDRLVSCRTSHKENTPCFSARVRWQGGGLEWFNENDVPIKDSVQFEWTEINK